MHFDVEVDFGAGQAPEPRAGQDWASWFFLVLSISAYALAGWMAWKNWKAGRTDRAGAWRLTWLVTAGALLTNLLAAHYNTIRNVTVALQNWLAVSVFVGV